ncbi:erythromycin esterase [Streptomyces sp. BSE7F]|uniref:erythromycin esterase family protein n=1 Tax=Streptomyces sp. BSE7-9 TaxID=2759948 RepID=UPI000D60F071|nr:erythromycin esterase family protein [Streptomyces sp. BSE7-9]MBJ6642725.1 erythromycin esterase family protein [Streptomyces sp. BSE7-9]PWE10298.1 erythromycin esterase [Streptomyces sp. BSE7F]
METGIEDFARPVEASAIMELLPTRPRVLALGEPTHGENTLLELRNTLFRQLVEEEGYRTIALESDCLRALTVDAYVTSGEGSLDDVTERGFSHDWGGSQANRELVRWMRGFNADRPADDHVRFAGMDGPLEISGAESPRQALTALHDYLTAHVDAELLPCTADRLDELLGADARWTNQAAMTDPSQSIGRTPEARELRLLADDMVTLLETQAPHLAAVSSPNDRDRARLNGRTAVGLLRYHSWMADTSPSRMARLLATRDEMMAGNLLALAARGPVLVHAHNSHLQRDKSAMSMWGYPKVEWWSAGALVGTRLGDQYAHLATALGTMRHQGVDAPPQDTVEGILHALPEPHCVIDAAQLDAAAEHMTAVPRVSPYFGYAPLDPSHLPRIDGVVYVRDVPHD